MTTFSTFADRWQATVLPLKRPSTVVAFRSHLGLFRASPLGEMPLSTIDTPSVQAVLTLQASSVAPCTVRNRWLTLRTVLAAAHREKLLAEIPKPVLPRGRKPEQPSFTAEEMRDIVGALDGQLKVFYALLAETGVRVGEALALWPVAVDLKRRVLTVERAMFNGKVGECKTDSSYRKLCLSEGMCEMLAPLVQKTDDRKPIFHTSKGTALWPAEIRRVVDAQVGNPAPFHAFRRGNVSLCHKKLGMPLAILARRVGHALEDITLGVYVQTSVEDDRPWVEQIAAALR